MPISRSQMERQLRMGGGIMEVAPRQGYFLGGVGDALKGAVKGVAKGISGILKSDLGKAALLGVGAFGLPGTSFKGFLGGGGFKLPEFLSGLSGEKTLGKTLKVGAAGSLLGAVLGGLDEEEEQDIKEGRNIAALETKLRTAYSDLGTFENDPEGLEAQIKSDLSEYSKDMSRGLMSIGGRAGFANGMNNPEDLPKGLRKDTTTSNPIPEDAPNMAAAEIAKVIMGTLGDGEDMTSRKFIFEKYVMPKRSQMMENFGIGLKEADNLIRQEMAKYRKNRADGGRIGYAEGNPDQKQMAMIEDMLKRGIDMDTIKTLTGASDDMIQDRINFIKYGGAKVPIKKADGGRMKYARGTDQIVDQASGIMGLPQRVNQAGVKELDLRESGGFIPPVGIKEKADDIPAMLSNNEFVFTADAVRGMGGGDVNRGAQRLYDQMKMLEKGGRV